MASKAGILEIVYLTRNTHPIIIIWSITIWFLRICLLVDIIESLPIDLVFRFIFEYHFDTQIFRRSVVKFTFVLTKLGLEICFVEKVLSYFPSSPPPSAVIFRAMVKTGIATYKSKWSHYKVDATQSFYYLILYCTKY